MGLIDKNQIPWKIGKAGKGAFIVTGAVWKERAECAEANEKQYDSGQQNGKKAPVGRAWTGMRHMDPPLFVFCRNHNEILIKIQESKI